MVALLGHRGRDEGQRDVVQLPMGKGRMEKEEGMKGKQKGGRDRVWLCLLGTEQAKRSDSRKVPGRYREVEEGREASGLWAGRSA